MTGLRGQRCFPVFSCLYEKTKVLAFREVLRKIVINGENLKYWEKAHGFFRLDFVIPTSIPTNRFLTRRLPGFLRRMGLEVRQNRGPFRQRLSHALWIT